MKEIEKNIPIYALTDIINDLNIKLKSGLNQNSFVVEALMCMVTIWSVSRSWRMGRVRKGEIFWLNNIRLTPKNAIFFQFTPIGGNSYDFIELSLEKAEEVFGPQLNDHIANCINMPLAEYAQEFIDRENQRVAALAAANEQMEDWGVF